MRLTCPACHAEQSLEAALGREADARAVAALVERCLPLGAALVRYIALFRPAKRRLGLDRLVTLMMELMPDIERGAITRKGRDWAAPQQLWQQAIEQVLATRDKGTLTLPLTSHGYLYEVLCGMSDKAEAAAERETEDQRRQRHTTGPRDEDAAPAAAVLARAVVAPAEPVAPANPAAIEAARAASARLRAGSYARQAVAPIPSTPEEP